MEKKIGVFSGILKMSLRILTCHAGNEIEDPANPSVNNVHLERSENSSVNTINYVWQYFLLFSHNTDSELKLMEIITKQILF